MSQRYCLLLERCLMGWRRNKKRTFARIAYTHFRRFVDILTRNRRRVYNLNTHSIVNIIFIYEIMLGWLFKIGSWNIFKIIYNIYNYYLNYSNAKLHL